MTALRWEERSAGSSTTTRSSSRSRAPDRRPRPRSLPTPYAITATASAPSDPIKLSDYILKVIQGNLTVVPDQTSLVLTYLRPDLRPVDDVDRQGHRRGAEHRHAVGQRYLHRHHDRRSPGHGIALRRGRGHSVDRDAGERYELRHGQLCRHDGFPGQFVERAGRREARRSTCSTRRPRGP